MAKIKDIRKAGTLLSNEFIAILNEVWPDVTPMPGTPHDDIQQKIGAVQVIREIKRWKEILDHPDEHNEDDTIF
jgi:hypothetical protein